LSNKVLSSSANLIAVVGLLLLSQAGCLWFELSGSAGARTRAKKTVTASHRKDQKTAHASHARSHKSRIPGHASKSKHKTRGARASHHGHQSGGHSRRHSSRQSGRQHHSVRSRHHLSQSEQAVKIKFVAPPDAGAPIDYSSAPRARNYALLTRSYTLYDEGVNEKLKGNYGAATDKLSESITLLDQARSNQHGAVPSTLESMVFFELGDAAESDGDFVLARDSYAHCLKAKPDFVEGYLHIVNLLATQGQLPLAASWLKEGLKECPHDQRMNEMSTQLSTYVGSTGTDLVPPSDAPQGPMEPENTER